MKRNIILVVTVFFVMLAGAAKPVQAGLAASWVPSVHSSNSGSWSIPKSLSRKAAYLNSAVGRFEGLLNAYSVNQKKDANIANKQVQLDNASRNLGNALEQFNLALLEVYPTLPEEEQSVVEEVYSSLGIYLEDLAEDANSVLGREVFRVEYSESSMDSFDFLDPKSFMEPLK